MQAAAAGVAGLVGPKPLSAQGPTLDSSGPYELMPEFWRVYTATRDKGDPFQRGLLIGRQFLLPNAAVYTAAGFNGGSHGRFYDNRVAQWLDRFDSMVPAIRTLSDRAHAAWSAHERRFRMHFPGYRPTNPIWFLVSLFAFDGYTRQWQGRQMMFFGLDGIVEQHGSTPDLKVLFDHEGFHLYQMQVNPLAAATLWARLWREGLATYASQRLNPDAALSDVLISQDLAAAPPGLVSRAAADALANLDELEGPVAHRLFDLGYTGDLPARTGYLLSLHVAQRAGATRTLDGLARLSTEDARAIVRAELAKLAK